MLYACEWAIVGGASDDEPSSNGLMFPDEPPSYPDLCLLWKAVPSARFAPSLVYLPMCGGLRDVQISRDVPAWIFGTIYPPAPDLDPKTARKR